MTCRRERVLACLPAIAAASIFFGQHDGQHPFGDGRIAGVRGMPLQVAIKIIDFEDDPAPIDSQDGAIVLTPGVVVFGELGEPGHGGAHFAHPVSVERSDASGDHDPAAGRFAAQLIIQFADAGCLYRRFVAHGSISLAGCRSAFALTAAWLSHSTSRASSASSSGSMSSWSITRSAPYLTACGKRASHQSHQNTANGRRS